MVKTNLTESDVIELVDKYSDLKGQIDALEKECDEVKEILVEYSKAKGQKQLVGSDKNLSIGKYETLTVPAKKDIGPLVEYLKENKYWDDFTQLDKTKLVKAIKEEKLSDDVLVGLGEFVKQKTMYRAVLVKKK